MEIIRWSEMLSPIGPLVLVSTEKGLCRLVLPGEGQATLLNWLNRKWTEEIVVERNLKVHQQAIEQLGAYFAGELQQFDLPLDVSGSPFQLQVWQELQKIPYGETRTYQEIATNIGKPRAVRAVGQANNRNPIPVIIPCHRVIGKSGALVGYGGGLEVKLYLLGLEGAPGFSG
ncbi:MULTISPECIES: methylated-DNA--[protein]-cysteine S-methyltransferase [unclassified Carboxydocella]|uniref:methylated-DNA--[protein]-cysteine S-methyltransferase n=1 Tax=unclassified Carboxydocella TaxID=2685367 RepID=UPI0009ADF677|nr:MULTISPECIES: methylated-DNA--[protein]-cysteine S-methyltransferase [unclassified Carboxydocella]AVX30124.1 methylated-DNA-[protein]-cysteine S-methyltransferase [Carboxydocella thermautotrophica]GAW29578.1 methylated-DNA-[protein]-cysteine S-methyltransferase [Carboxydocella sp. ULO1]GAW32409.1 methylated-DNA-[protein]-cysteine S-methyltransferase [Carboxydocella sp. JDF658]